MIKKAFRDDSVNKAQKNFLCQGLKLDWESSEIDPYSRRPSTSRTLENVEYVQAAIKRNQ